MVSENIKVILQIGNIYVLYCTICPRRKDCSQGTPKQILELYKTKKLQKMSPRDFLEYYNNKYTGLRDILLKKIQAVSINKASESYSEVSVIGMVRETVPGGFVMEDETGEITVISRENVEPDDVVGASGHIKEGQLFSSGLIWPDVPLNNKPNPSIGLNILFVWKVNERIMKIIDSFGLVFARAESGINPTEIEQKVVQGLPNPCHARIISDSGELRLLFYEPATPPASEACRIFLRRRHFSPDKKNIFSTTDPFLIDPVPDVCWLISDKQHVERYKGVTIIMSRKQDVVKYDAKEGKVFFATEGDLVNKSTRIPESP